MSPNSAVYLLVGNTLTLSCSGEPGDGINISTIQFEKGDRTPLQSYVQLSSEGAQLQIHAMTANGRGMYYYCFNEEPADKTGTFVWVGGRQCLFMTVRASTAHRNRFPIMKNKCYYFKQCYTIFEIYLN